MLERVQEPISERERLLSLQRHIRSLSSAKRAENRITVLADRVLHINEFSLLFGPFKAAEKDFPILRSTVAWKSARLSA